MLIEQQKYALETLEDVDLAQEEKWEYIIRMHRSIDKVIECRTPLHLRFGENFQLRKVTYHKKLKFFDSETESDDEIRQAKE